MSSVRERLARGIVAAAVAVLLAACATQKATVVLLPEKDGGSTSIVVTQGKEQVVLDQPYAAVRETSSGMSAYTSNPQEVKTVFGAALAAQPSRPTSFKLYFNLGGEEFTDASKQILANMLAEIAAHTVPDIVVIGHTDRVGSDPFNDALALRRAETVREMLIARGLPRASIMVAGRGKREPIVPTADGVPEPRNRRVEIVVR